MEISPYIPDDTFTQYLNRYYARSGSVPSAGSLERMIQSQIERETNRRFRLQSQALQQKELTERARQFDIGTTQREYDRYGQSATGLLGSVAQLGTAYMLDEPTHSYLKKKILGYDEVTNGY